MDPKPCLSVLDMGEGETRRCEKPEGHEGAHSGGGCLWPWPPPEAKVASSGPTPGTWVDVRSYEGEVVALARVTILSRRKLDAVIAIVPVDAAIDEAEALTNGRVLAAAPKMLEALRTTAGNIRSLGPAGALDNVPEPYRAWLATVEAAIASAEERS